MKHMKTKHDGYVEADGPAEPRRNQFSRPKPSHRDQSEVLNSTQELYELMQDSSVDLSDSGSITTERVKRTISAVRKEPGFKRFCRESDGVQTRRHNSVIQDVRNTRRNQSIKRDERNVG